jgi:predicted small lipoprotein YifL
MLRSLRLLTLIAVSLAVAGCGSSNTEIPPTKEAAPTMTKQESAAKAMEGMPPEIRAKMEAMKAKQSR